MTQRTGLANQKIDAFKAIMNEGTIRAQLKNSLKDKSGAFASSMVSYYSNDKGLLNCDPYDVAIECLKAAFLDLPLSNSLGFAYVVPYKNKPTFTIGYKGYIQLAMRTGQYKTINADCVYEGEFTGKNKLSGEVFLDGEKESDEVIGYFAYYKTTNNFEKTIYMTKEEITAWAKKYSPSFNTSFSPWKTEFDKMAQKTVLRRLISTYGIMSIQMQDALSSDNDSVEDVRANVNNEIGTNANSVIIDISQEDMHLIDEVIPEPEY